MKTFIPLWLWYGAHVKSSILLSLPFALSHTHTHATHRDRHQALLSARTSLLPPPAPLFLWPLLPLFYPVLTVTSVNGFTRFVNVVGLKLYCVLSLFCSITAELRSKLSLLCILLLLLLFPQHPPPTYRSMSTFDMHEKKSICWKKKRSNKGVGCQVVFHVFFSTMI